MRSVCTNKKGDKRANEHFLAFWDKWARNARGVCSLIGFLGSVSLVARDVSTHSADVALLNPNIYILNFGTEK